MLYKILASKVSTFLFLILTCIITYINILPNKLFFDDEELIYKNIYIQNLRFLPKYFTENMVAGAGKISNMYRPALLLSFAIDWKIWGDNPVGYHLTSIFLHCINSILVFILISKLYSKKIALLTSTLFSIHPAISEAIIYPSGRTDPLYCLFALLALILWNKFILRNNIVFYLVSLLFFILSLLSKESAIILPFLCMLILYKNYQLSFTKETLYKISLSFPYFTIDIFYFVLRLTKLNFLNSLNFYLVSSLYSTSILVRLYTFCKVFFDYIFLLIFPRDLLIAHNPKIIDSLANFWVILFAISSVTTLYVFKKNKNIIFTIGWIFISLLPVSGIIPINNIMADHYLYLPAIGFFTFASCAIEKFMKKKGKKFTLFIRVLITLYSMWLISRTIARTFEWRDAIVFYTISLSQSPGHIPMLNNLAMAYDEKGYKLKAKEIYLKIINLNDVYPNVHHNLGILYESENDLVNAKNEYQKALQLDPNFSFSKAALYNLENNHE
jgi:tetratricopeptide (TPR) repeat protein